MGRRRGDHGHAAATSEAAGFMSAADKTKLDGMGGGGGEGLQFAAPLTLDGQVLRLPEATGTASGAMSATDKSKLDGMAPGSLTGGTMTGPLRFAYGLNPAMGFHGWGGAEDVYTVRLVFNEGVSADEWSLFGSGTPMLVLEGWTGDVRVEAGSLKLNAGVLKISGQQVVGMRQEPIADAAAATGTATQNGYGFGSAAEFNNFKNDVNGAVAQLNRALEALRVHGLIGRAEI